jgi:hypothetical protein
VDFDSTEEARRCEFLQLLALVFDMEAIGDAGPKDESAKMSSVTTTLKTSGRDQFGAAMAGTEKSAVVARARPNRRKSRETRMAFGFGMTRPFRKQQTGHDAWAKA